MPTFKQIYEKDIRYGFTLGWQNTVIMHVAPRITHFFKVETISLNGQHMTVRYKLKNGDFSWRNLSRENLMNLIFAGEVVVLEHGDYEYI